MRDFFVNILTSLREFFGKMSRKNKIRLAILSAAVVALAIIVVAILGQTKYALLRNAASTSEAGQIITALQEMNVPYKMDGPTRIMVPESRVNEVNAQLASQGIVSDELNMTIINSATGFGMTDAQAQRLAEYQKGEDIKWQILAIDKILSCRALVNFGESSPFAVSRTNKEAQASIMLKIRNDAMLSKAETQAIAEIVRTNVPGITYENISITDSNLNSYSAVGTDDVDIGEVMNMRVALQNLLSQQYQTQCEQLLTPVFGMSNVRIMVSLTLNWDTHVTETIVYTPLEGQIDGVVRSSSELYETQLKDGAATGVPGTDTNGMGAEEYPYGTLDDGETYKRVLIEKNYEISETRQMIDRAQGAIESLSVGVTLNSDIFDEEYDGDYVAQTLNVLSQGLGVGIGNVGVEAMPFIEIDTTLQDMFDAWDAYEASVRRQELISTIIMWAVVLLLGLALIMLVRTIVKGNRDAQMAELQAQQLALAGGGIDVTVGPEDEDIEAARLLDEMAAAQSAEIEIKGKSSDLEQIEKFIEKDPASVALLLRNWLSDET